MVDETRNCEDIALPMIISKVSRLPGVYVDGLDRYQHLQDQNKKGHHPGLNKLAGHYGERNMCVNEMAKLLGGMPLIYSNIKIRPVEFNEV